MNLRFFRFGSVLLSWLVLLLTSLFSTNTAAFVPGNLLHTFDDPTVTDRSAAGNRDQFGNSVSVDGNHVLIGAWKDDTNGFNVGQAHLFDATTGNLLLTFDDPTITGEDHFGNSVSVDGNHVLIGAWKDNTNGSEVGQAHLFDATTGNLLHTFNDPTVTSRDFFGSSVSVDGNHVLIGAPGDNTSDSAVGQAHLFDATTGNLLHTFNDPTVSPHDFFGSSVSVDGNRVLIGAPRDDTNGSFAGQAHLFDVTTGNLLHTFNDPTATSGHQFGSSVAIDGNHVLIGAPVPFVNNNANQAHLFDATTGNLLHTFNDPTTTGGDQFGSSVAIDGNHVLIGAERDSSKGHDIGQAHLFDATTGNLLHNFNDPTVTIQDWFGSSVAIDGNHVLIGARGDNTNGSRVGQAYLFDARVPEPGTGGLLVGLALVVSGCGRRGRVAA